MVNGLLTMDSLLVGVEIIFIFSDFCEDFPLSLVDGRLG